MGALPMYDLPPDEEIARKVSVSFFLNGFWSRGDTSHYNAFEGMDPEEFRGVILGQALADAARYREVRALRESGLSVPKIIQRTDNTVETVKGWVFRGALPKRLRELVCGKEAVAHEFNPPREEHIDLAYIFGQSLGRMNSGTDMLRRPEVTTEKAVVELKTNDLGTAEVFRGHVRKVFSPVLDFAPDAKFKYHLRVNSLDFGELFDETTNHGQEMPWGLLGTNAEYRAYAQGQFFARFPHKKEMRESEKAPARIATSFSFPSFIDEFSLLFHLLGFSPGFHQCENGTVRLYFSDPDDLMRMRDAGMFAGYLKNGVDKFIEAKAKPGPDGDFRGQYHVANAYVEYAKLMSSSLPNNVLARRAIAERFSMSPNTIHSWYERGTTPDIVKRRTKLEELVRKLPNPRDINHIYRTSGVDSKIARQIVREYVDSIVLRYAEFCIGELEFSSDEREALLLQGPDALFARLDAEEPEVFPLNGDQFQITREARLGYMKHKGQDPLTEFDENEFYREISILFRYLIGRSRPNNGNGPKHLAVHGDLYATVEQRSPSDYLVTYMGLRL